MSKYDFKRFMIRRILAAKEEELSEKPSEDKPEETTEFLKSPDPRGNLQVTGKIYYYSAPPTEAIPFGSMYAILSGEAPGATDSDREALYNKLKGGSAPYAADYFKWIGLAVLAQEGEDEKRKVSYLYLTSDWGGFDPTRTYMQKSDQPDFDPPNPKDAAKLLNLFETVGNLQDIVDLATGPGVLFSNSMPNENIPRRLLVETLQSVAGSTTDSGDFADNGVMNENYRIRALSVAGTPLRKIDGTISNEDNIGPGGKKGYYPGGEKAFRELMESTGYKPQEETEEKSEEKGAPEESLKEQKEEEESKYRSVDEVEPTTKEEVNMRTTQASDKTGFIKEIEEDDPRANHYTGDWGIMRDLVKLQRKKMKIRKEAGTEVNIDVTDTQKAKEQAKKVHEFAQAKENLEEDLKRSGLNLTKKPGSTGVTANTVNNVLNRFLKK